MSGRRGFVPPDLADATVLDADRNPVRLGDLWKDHTTVLAFVRHFG
jgi:hypothetical protein